MADIATAAAAIWPAWADFLAALTVELLRMADIAIDAAAIWPVWADSSAALTAESLPMADFVTDAVDYRGNGADFCLGMMFRLGGTCRN